MLLEKAEMFLLLSVSMYQKNRVNIAVWATKQSEKYIDLHEKGETK